MSPPHLTICEGLTTYWPAGWREFIHTSTSKIFGDMVESQNPCKAKNHICQPWGQLMRGSFCTTANRVARSQGPPSSYQPIQPNNLCISRITCPSDGRGGSAASSIFCMSLLLCLQTIRNTFFMPLLRLTGVSLSITALASLSNV